MSDDDKKATDGTANETNSLKHIGGSHGKLTAHQKRERSCRRDSFAGSLGVPFQYQGNVADRKNVSSNENNAVADVADSATRPQ
jgi:hypothetical protein